MPNYAPRVSFAYADVSGVIETWSHSCEKMVVYEHQRDSEVNRTHLHMLLMNCKYNTAEPLKRQFYSAVQTSAKGNDLWSWVHKKYPNPNEQFVVYMSEGKLRPVFVKNFSPAELEELRLQWKEESTPKGESLTEKKESTKSKYDLVQDMISEIDNSKVDGMCSRYLADYLVSVVLKVLRKNRIVIGRYKVREYRDALIYYNDKLEKKFINFVNEDFKDEY